MISYNAHYWIWLSQALGYNSHKVGRLYQLYPNIRFFYEGNEREWRFSGILNDTDIDRLKQTKLKDAQKIIERCEKMHYSVISIDDINYPECLRPIYAPPAVLYVSGNLPDVDNCLSIAIVGTRTASSYGTKNAYKIAYSLSKFGVCTVSGGALGVDCAAHRGSLAANGVTICVLGCGINYPYLKENAGMRRAITADGALVSEYPPDTPPKGYHFPARNRIIAALSNGVLIIESGAKSGSLITANYALDMGRDVFALLGNNSPQNEGSNQRIKEGSAIPITDFMDILTNYDNLVLVDKEFELNDLAFADIEAIPVKLPAGDNKGLHINVVKNHPKKEETKKPPQEPPVKKNAALSGDLKKVYDILTAEPTHIDTVSAKAEMPVYRVLAALTELEMMDLVQAIEGRRFLIK